MKIHGDFIGGNIEVVKTEGNHVYLQNQIRDSMEDWFYWAFCVEGAQGQTLTFHLDKQWIGYYGPAVSRDLRNWHWLGAEDESCASSAFTYTFSQNESKVYFAHDMLYHPDRFADFCQKHGLELKTLCKSGKGRDIPYVRIGEGNETILLAARHHACEATGSYVLEGVLEELLKAGFPGFQIIAVPFMDYDGVIDGDQGKSRSPWDHNRDYDPGREAIYPSVKEVRKIAAEGGVRYAFDFHSPWHVGGENDLVFIPLKHASTIKSDIRFAALLEHSATENALPYEAANTFPADYKWNSSKTTCFGNYMYWTAGAELAFTLETPYFRASGQKFTQERAVETGRCFARALRAYHSRPVKISFTGDLLYQSPINELCKTDQGYDFAPLLAPLRTRLPDADYLVGNLESPVAGEENGGYTHEKYCFNTPKQSLSALKDMGFDLLTLANNHCMDRGQEGIEATLDACNQAGLEHIGLYRTKAESDAVFIREIGGLKIGFVNATYGTNAFSHRRFLENDKKHMVALTQPEETLDGSIDLLEPLESIEKRTARLYHPVNPALEPYLQQLQRRIRQTRERSDYVIMLLHSGGQYNTKPDGYTKMLVEKIREYGADIIIVNHPHILLPSSCQNGYFIAYCLGNLISAVPGNTIDCDVNPDFSAVLNLYLEQSAGKLLQHITFRLCQTIHPDHGRSAPYTVDTFEVWKNDPTEEYRREILKYANRFMPGKNYSQPQAEYVVC